MIKHLLNKGCGGHFFMFFNIPEVLEGLKKSKKFKMFKNLLLNTKCYTRRIS